MDMDGDSSGEEEHHEQYDSHRLGYNPQVQDGGYDPQLENVRMESIQKIRGRFEHIYQKYGKDFEGVADEIDMTTGVIVVNNGHLQNMEHEVDAGNGDALALSRTFDDDEDDDEDEDGSSGSEIEAAMDQDGGNESNSVSSDDPELDFSWQDDTAASFSSPDEDGDALPNSAAVRPSTPTNGPKRLKGKERATSNAPARDPSSEDIFEHMKDSMLALKDKYQKGQDMAPDDIQALGMSIANQLASFITGGKASKKRKRQSAPNRLESLEHARGRRRTRSQSSVDPVAPTPARSPGNISLWAPLNQPKGRRTPKKKKGKSAAVEEQAGDDSLIDTIVLQTIMDQSALEPDELQGPTTVRSCSNCKTTETLHWRRGPRAVDLCNNCGMYYYRYGVMRPLHVSPPPREKSPTPEPVYTDPRQKPAPYSANTSRPLDGVNLFGLHFSTREDAQLIKLKEIDRLTWDQIAMQHPGRTPYALQCRYSKHLHGKPCEARDMLSSRGYQFYIDSNGLTIAHQPGQFTEEEDDMLLKLREEDGLDWNRVALELPGRRAEDVEKRYDEMVAQYLRGGKGEVSKAKSKPKPKSKSKKRRRDSSASDRSNARYTPDEDGTILRLREDDKLSWETVSKQMPGRTLGSVQRRYSRDIGPYGRSRSSTPRASPAPGEAPPRPRKYTDEEDATLIQLRDEEDLEWEQITEHLPERSASSLANRYYYKVSKDDSRASSRASSVASSRRRCRSGSLPALDLVAQMDDAQTETPSEEDTFTESEDNLIVKLRELECLSWDQIAAEMPGRDVSSISCRYYQYLLPRKVPEIRGTEQTLDPALQSAGFDAQPGASNDTTGTRPRDTSVDVDELLDITAPTTNGTAAAPATRGSSSRKRKSDAPQQGRSVAGRRSDAPMLRRALQKNLNRRSSRVAAPAEIPDMSMMMDGANDDVLDDGDELSESNSMPSEPVLLPSALPAHHEVEPPASDRKLRSSSKRKSLYPETPLRGPNGPYPSSGPTAFDHSLYFTPSRYQAQSHPYFLANAASVEEPPVPASNRKARTKRAAGERRARSDGLEEEIAFEGGKEPFRKRRRAPKPTRAARPRQIQTIDIDNEDDGLEGSADDDHAGEYFTSRKKKRGPSDAQKLFRGRKSTAADMRDDSETILPSLSKALSVDSDEETEEEEVDMPDLGTDDDDDSSESDEEDEDDDELRCKPRERSPLFDPRETIEEAKHKKEAGPMRGKLTTAAKAGDGNTMDDLNLDVDISTIPPEHLVRPDISWTQLNFIALKSRAPEPMYTREIYAYLEQHFPFFRLCKGHWRDSIRGNLSTRPEFVKDSKTKGALWCLADPDQEAIVVPKGERRGRCPVGVARSPKKEEGPKKKGRPSNASKGLPLKRAYKRNYIPAAEKRRLAALEAEGGAAVVAPGATEEDNTASLDDTTMAAPADEDTATNAEAAASVPEDNEDGRYTRPSTIEDSDAGEQLEFAECSADQPNDTEAEIKTEPQLPEPTFVAPVANMTAPTSDIDREPGGTSDAPDNAVAAAAAAMDELSSEATPASIATSMHQAGLRSSPPALVSATTSTRRLSRTYGRTSAINTPATGRSTLFKQLASAHASSAVMATPAFRQMARSSRVSRAGTPGSTRRTVQTPARETEGSEDELA